MGIPNAVHASATLAWPHRNSSAVSAMVRPRLKQAMTRECNVSTTMGLDVAGGSAELSKRPGMA